MKGIAVTIRLWGLLVILMTGNQPLLKGQTFSEDSLHVLDLLEKSDFWIRRNTDSSLAYAQSALEMANRLGNPRLQIYSIQNVAHIRKGTGKLETADSLYHAALALAQKHDIRPVLANLYINIGTTRRLQGDMSDALRKIHQGIAINEKEQDSSGMSWGYNMLGNMYNSLEYHEKALEYHRKSLKINEAMGAQLPISVNLNNIASTLRETGQFDSALVYFEKALAQKEELEDDKGKTRVLANIGVIYTQKGQYDLGRKFLLEAKGEADRLNMKLEKIQGLTNLAWLERLEGNFREAIRLGERAAEMIEGDEMPESQLEMIKELSQAYEANGQTQKALDFLRKYESIRSQLFPEDLPLQLVENEAKLELEKQQAEINLLQSQDEIKQLKLERRNRQIFWILTIVALLIVLMAILYNRYQLKHKTAQELQVLDAAKSRFFANLSHEFRTPLTLIIGRLEQPENGNLSPKDHQSLLHSARQLLNLNDQLLDLARIDANAMQIHAQNGDPVAFIRNSAEAFRPLAEANNIDFTIDLPAPSATIGFDEEKLGKILNNLLSNAFKYTPEGGKIALSAEIKNGIRVMVSNSGEGIPEAELQAIFDRHYRLNRHLESNISGAGLGLSLVRELVDLMGGKIDAKSETGKETQFSVWLPILQADEISAEIAPDDVSADSKSTMRPSEKPILLIVEDNAELRNLIADVFRDNYLLREAVNGHEALEIAREELPDLVLSDLMMPEMDGLELCAALKSDFRTNHIPFVLLTALSEVESRIRGLETGADDYISKPFHSRELKVRVANLIRQRELLQERFSGENLQIPSPEPDPEEEFYLSVIRNIDSHLDDSGFNVDALSREVGLSRVQLFRKLKAVSGKSPGQLIQETRLSRASELLRNSGETIAEVMYRCGFDNSSYFAKKFREQFGVSPSEFREQA